MHSERASGGSSGRFSSLTITGPWPAARKDCAWRLRAAVLPRSAQENDRQIDPMSVLRGRTGRPAGTPAPAALISAGGDGFPGWRVSDELSLEVVRAQDSDSAAIDPDDALLAPVVQDAVDALARGSHHAGQITLGQGKIDPNAFRRSDPSLGAELEKLLGKATGKVKKVSPAELVVQSSDVTSQDRQDALGSIDVLTQESAKVLPVEHERLDRFKGNDGRRARLIVQQGHLAEEIAGAKQCDDRFITLSGRENDLDLTAQENDQVTAGLSLGEDGLPAAIAAELQAFCEMGPFARGEAPEERNGGKDGISIPTILANRHPPLLRKHVS